MTWDDAVDAMAEGGPSPTAAMQWVLGHWDVAGPLCRALLHGYVTGADMSERTERALSIVVHLLAEQCDSPCFPALCRLAADTDRAASVLGDDNLLRTMPCLLISTFDGDASALRALVADGSADEPLRADILLVLAYLTRTHRIAESQTYDYLACLPNRLTPQQPSELWFGYGRAVAALGFAGLAGPVEQAMLQGWIDPALMDTLLFWETLRAAQADPWDVSGPAWADLGPIGSAQEWLDGSGEPDASAPLPEPVRNPLRHVGRNDPCPCGSGRKYKKCCLAA